MNRIGMVSVIVENLDNAPQVNKIIGEMQHLILGRIGMPDKKHALGIIGLIVKGSDVDVSRLTARLGNVGGVIVKSAMTSKYFEDEGENIL